MSRSFQLDLGQVDFIGTDLMRPECVLATRGGHLYASDWRGGVAHLSPDGTQRFIGCAPSRAEARLMPNGIALLRDHSLLVANLGDEGGVWRLFPDGHYEPWLTEVSGQRLPAVNFVWLDDQERVWMTVMFRSHPGAGQHKFRADLGDGYVILADGVEQPQSARVVAEGLFTPNECRIALDGKSLVVNETFSNRVVRYALRPDGSLGARDVLAQFDEDTLPDGLTLDVEGGMWVTGIAANRFVRVMPDGSWTQLSQDVNPDHMRAVREAIRDGTLDRALLYSNPATVLPNITSVAFGGDDLRIAYVGSVSGRSIARFHAPVAGVPPVHWSWR